MSDREIVFFEKPVKVGQLEVTKIEVTPISEMNVKKLRNIQKWFNGDEIGSSFIDAFEDFYKNCDAVNADNQAPLPSTFIDNMKLIHIQNFMEVVSDSKELPDPN